MNRAETVVLENIDYVLVLNTLNGDKESFSRLASKYESSLYSFLYKMTLSKQDAEDILQEVFVRAYNNLYKYNKNWSFATWIFRIALNTFNNEYKRNKKKYSMYSYEDIPEIHCNICDLPEVAYEINENRQRFIRIINSLKIDQKTALCLKHLQGFTFAEIGSIMDVSAESAKMKVQRAKQILKKKLKAGTGGMDYEM